MIAARANPKSMVIKPMVVATLRGIVEKPKRPVKASLTSLRNVYLGSPYFPLVPIVFYSILLESRPTAQPSHKTYFFRQMVKNFHYLAVHKAEIPGIKGNIRIG